MPYKVEALEAGAWSSNVLVFATEVYALDLQWRWLAEYRVVETAEQPNYEIRDGRMQRLELRV